MTVERNFDIKTSLFRLPQGTSPTDNSNIDLVKRIMKSATGAENVKVSFHNSPNGEPLTDLYNIQLDFPRYLEAGEYISLKKQGALQGEAADLIGQIIKALANGQDASAQIQKLLEVTKGGDSEDSKPEEGSATGPSKAPGGAGGPSGGGGFPGGPGGQGGPSSKGLPGAGGGKMPFAKKQKQSKLRRAILAEKKLGMKMGEAMKLASFKTDNWDWFVNRIAAVKFEFDLDSESAAEIVKIADTSNSWAQFHSKISKAVLDENDKPLSGQEYQHIALVAKGEKPAPLA